MKIKRPYRICIRLLVCWAIACCFFGYWGQTLFVGDVTGSTSIQTDWLLVFSHRSQVSESPLRKWSNQNHLSVTENFKVAAFGTHSLFLWGHGGGDQKPAIWRFDQYLQEVYVAKEDEKTVRQFLTDMMATSDETVREKLVEKARARAEELAGIAHETS